MIGIVFKTWQNTKGKHTLESKIHLHYTVEYFDRKWKIAVGNFR